MLEALRHLPETPEHARRGVDVRLALRAPLWRGGQPDRLFQLYKDAEALAARHGFSDALETIYAYFVQHHWAKGEHGVAIEYGQRCLERAAVRGDLPLRVTGLLYMGHARIGQGRFPEALAHYRELMDLLEGPRATERFGLSGQPYCSAAANASEALCELGDVAGALAVLERGQTAADASGHLYSQMVVAAYRGAALFHVGRLDEAISLSEATSVTCREKKFVGQLINARRFVARAYVEVGRPADAARAVQESIALHEAAGVSVVRATQLTTLALAQLALGEQDAARRTLAEAITSAERQGERWCEGWARLVLGEVEAAAGDRSTAEAELDQAQEIGEEMGMRPLVERCRRLARRLG